jgi:hypothetical protein
MITGAQTGVPAVAISGPNAMLSRLSFDVSAEDLNSKTFVSSSREDKRHAKLTSYVSLEHHSRPRYRATD